MVENKICLGNLGIRNFLPRAVTFYSDSQVQWFQLEILSCANRGRVPPRAAVPHEHRCSRPPTTGAIPHATPQEILDKRKRPTQTVSRGRALSDWEEGPELLRIAAPSQPDGAASLVKCLAASRAASDQDWRGP